MTRKALGLEEKDGSSANTLSLNERKNTILNSHGRAPWYGQDGKRITDAFVIGVAGGSASGKTHVAQQIVKSLGNIPTVIILSQDSFYKKHSPEELVLAHANMYDFDHPDAIDMPMFAACLADLKACKQSNIPIYSFAEHQRLEETQYLYGAAIIIAEGIMALHDPKLRELYDLKVFVQCDSDLMLARRIARDVQQRGRNVDGILEQYLRYVKPSFDNFVRPSAAYADIIVPGSNNSVAIDLICTHVKRQLQDRSNAFREKMAIPRLYVPSYATTLEELNLTILPSTPQIEGIFTILRAHDTSRQDFIFFVDRLSTLLVEAALQYLPFSPTAVETPIGVKAEGKKLGAKYICGVSIQRSGCCLERGFKRVINNVPLGTLLIQSNVSDGEPLFLHGKLPVWIRERHTAEDTYVFLLDAQIGTGAAAFMSIRILLDHGVKQENIIFVTFLVAKGGGISVLRRAFPHVKIVCGAVDDEMREVRLEQSVGEDGKPTRRKVWVMEPGMGQIGDRYYFCETETYLNTASYLFVAVSSFIPFIHSGMTSPSNSCEKTALGEEEIEQLLSELASEGYRHKQEHLVRMSPDAILEMKRALARLESLRVEKKELEVQRAKLERRIRRSSRERIAGKIRKIKAEFRCLIEAIHICYVQLSLGSRRAGGRQ
ncbi:Uridine kinase [Paramarasmius palmivorus]|uniref:Uridine kinase n=1 Tax=Paramarasmius palmivorus TaxID=297713 RepID=A0AAW0DLA5_9AGAR